MLSTGDAARICGVKPDTVLKWVRSGRLCAMRTAGGHYRIHPRDLQPFLVKPAAASPARKAEDLPALRCWEYMSRDGEIRPSCHSCIAYTSGASRCWALRQHLEFRCASADDFGGTACSRCALYHRAFHGLVRVLLITSDAEIAACLQTIGCPGYELRVVANGYQAAAELADFCAAFAIIDAQVLRNEPALPQRLLEDRRAHGLKVLLAGRAPRHTAPAATLDAFLPKNFQWEDICQFVERFPVAANARRAPCVP